jgi:CSLREA domain-containing protein
LRFPVFALVALACVLAAPAAASAAGYVVNSTGDEADETLGSDGCKTSLSTCTLRAAVEESNDSVDVEDTITFDATVFAGQVADTISIGAGFPAITDKVSIDGDGSGQCTTAAAGAKGPCVGVEKTVAGSTLVVENADGVTIEGLAVTGSSTGINVLDSSEGFTARNDWLGVKLDGTAGTNTTGIFLDPNSNGATIGGTAVADRNVFANNGAEGLDIQGASLTQVSGNYFGVSPDGQTQAANGKNIEVTSSFTVEATGNQIGAELSSEALATPACDGACNVISGSLSSGIDLLGEGGGEEPPGETTTIRGNYIGLTATGGALGNATIGVQVGKSRETKIGGELAASANHINGGQYGISASSGGVGADDLWIWNNLIGLNAAGTATLLPPSVDAIFNSGEGLSSLTKGARIYDNRISMLGGIAIEQHSIGALIHGNQIGRGTGGQSLSGGSVGIKLWGPSISASTVEFNRIENATANGILVENNFNLLIGNTIVGSGEAGIRIQDFLTLSSTNTAIAGEAEASENTISDSGGDAIEVAGEEDDETQIGRNKGSGNKGLFIDLGADGAGNKLTGPNDGIQPPTIAVATTTGASGAGARAGATVRVFRKATASPGELESFLGKATADSSGEWSLAYAAAIPGGTNIAATQSDVKGTSELTPALTAAPPDGGGGEGKEEGGGGKGKDDGGGGAGGKSGDDKGKAKGKDKGKGSAADKKAPETTIIKGPKARTHSRTARFKFTSSEAGSNYRCKLDRKPFRPCRPGKRYKGLKPGKHVFKVKAIDLAGNVDPTPAKRTFRVLD